MTSGNYEITWSSWISYSDKFMLLTLTKDSNVYKFSPHQDGQIDITFLAPKATEATCGVGSLGRRVSNGQCKCILGYHWDKTEQRCEPACNTGFDAGVSTSDDMVCDCEGDTVWNAKIRACALVCNTLENSARQWI